MHNIVDATENYLEAIYRMRRENDSVKAIEIAKFLELSKPSVSNAMKRLKEDALIDIDTQGGISLTAKGEIIALRTYEKHEFFKNCLIKAGIEEAVADDEACKIEHVISGDSFEKIKHYIEALQLGDD
ncbi:metal-dependent transcriptional regulator [Fusibacter sp. JL298sf-3]